MKRICLIRFIRYGHCFQFLQTAVKQVAVYISLDALQLAAVGILPEVPGTLIGQFVYIIMSNPERIGVQQRIAQVFHLELIAGINNGLYLVALFYQRQPFLDLALEVFLRQVARLFHIEHRRQGRPAPDVPVS